MELVSVEGGGGGGGDGRGGGENGMFSSDDPPTIVCPPGPLHQAALQPALRLVLLAGRGTIHPPTHRRVRVRK